jgi:hypothetical protein
MKVGRYLKNTTYYIGEITDSSVWVCIEACEELEEFPLFEDKYGKYFWDIGAKVYLDFA